MWYASDSEGDSASDDDSCSEVSSSSDAVPRAQSEDSSDEEYAEGLQEPAVGPSRPPPAGPARPPPDEVSSSSNPELPDYEDDEEMEFDPAVLLASKRYMPWEEFIKMRLRRGPPAAPYSRRY